jgi:hypothetical protein
MLDELPHRENKSHLINVFVVKYSGTAQRSTQEIVQTVGTPKDSFSTFFLHVVCYHLASSAPVQSNSKG